MPVVILNAFSTNGRIPSTMKPTDRPAAPVYRQFQPMNRMGSSEVAPAAIVASIIASAVAPPTSIKRLRVRTSSIRNPHVRMPTHKMRKNPIPWSSAAVTMMPCILAMPMAKRWS